MASHNALKLAERWFRLLLRLYPPDFRDEMGEPLVEAYRDRARDALAEGGVAGVLSVCVRAFWDSLRNGVSERPRPAAQWRRSGDWGRDIELMTRRLRRAPAFTVATLATLTIGLGMFAVVYGVVEKVLIAPLPYAHPDDLYFVWRDFRPVTDVQRGLLSGPDVIELQKARGVIAEAVAMQRCLCGTFAVSEASERMEIAVTMTSPNIFHVLGVKPAIGRAFAPDEVGPGRSQ